MCRRLKVTWGRRYTWQVYLTCTKWLIYFLYILKQKSRMCLPVSWTNSIHHIPSGDGNIHSNTFPAFIVTWRFIIIFTRPYMRLVKPVHFLASCFVNIQHNIILPYLPLSSPTWSHPYPTHATWLSHFMLLNLITLMASDKEYKLWGISNLTLYVFHATKNKYQLAAP